MVNEMKLDSLLIELGHDDFNRGTAQLREAVKRYEPGMAMTKELYPGLAKAIETTPARVERNIRHCIEKAWRRADYQVQMRYFGISDRPTNSEYVARLHALCRE
jgi:two-component system response regulator (stage 0 sporulation protein A)